MRTPAIKRTIGRRGFVGAAGGVAAAAAVPHLDPTSAAASVAAAGANGDPPRPTGSGRGSQVKVVLITGTSSGFGWDTALTLARQGHEVHASMRDLRGRNARAGRELQRITRREGLAVEVVDIDVRSDRSVSAGVQRVLDRAGGIDVLVNNAGIFYPALLETQTIAQVQEIFETNVFGALRMNRAVLPTMRDQREGLVVQMTSGVGRIAFPFQGAYNGSKWATEGLAQVSRYELSQSGVDVVIVEPGAYPTGLIDNARRYYRHYLRRLSRADARRRAEYGDLASRVENELQEPSEPNPQDVADAIAALVHMAPGQRPLRTLVGEDVQLLTEINEVHERIQNEIMGYAGYDDLISVPKRAPSRQ